MPRARADEDTGASPSVAVLADAAPTSGLGHLSRSSALAGALAQAGAAVRCVALDGPDRIWDGVAWAAGTIADAAGAELVVLDSYRHALDRPVPMVVFDDGSEPPAQAVVVIAPSSTSADPRFLTGLGFACLRRAYWDPVADRGVDVVRRVLVTTGGSDPGGVGARLAGALAVALPASTVALVRGPAASSPMPAGVEALTGVEDLRPHLIAADLLVSAAGQTLLEGLATGIPAVGFAVVDNQRRQAAAIAANGAAVVVAPEDALAAARELAADADRRRELSRRGRGVVDGRGAHRVAERVLAAARGA
jgi:spore coat polysaccharide biosynthesis predicted glycosyltransferase SpsG